MSDINIIMGLLKKDGSLSIDSISKSITMPTERLVEILQDMERQHLISIEYTDTIKVEISEEGIKDIKDGFPEEHLLEQARVSNLHISKTDNIALGWAIKNEWVKINNGIIEVADKGLEAKKSDYPLRKILTELHSKKNIDKKFIDNNMSIIKTLEGRKLISIKNGKIPHKITVLNNTEEMETGISQLTRAMIKDGSWKNMQFKKYDINAGSEPIYPARMHPMHIFLNKIASIWVSMGFNEVKGPIIEPAFWNFDTLFIPQDHPSRDTQDTFFLSNPRDLDITDIELMSKLKREHKRWWKYELNEQISKMSVLRTQTTSVSARQMRIIGRSTNPEYPIKLFSIGKVFRNESIDYKHLAEFYQLEGLVVGPGLSLAHLIGIIKEFASNLGIDIKIRPSSFAFVEPGLEVYFYSEKHKTNIELSGGGIIRKEITNSMGIKKPVLAWGMGLDRVIMDELKMNSITELYKNQLGWLRSIPDIN